MTRIMTTERQCTVNSVNRFTSIGHLASSVLTALTGRKISLLKGHTLFATYPVMFSTGSKISLLEF